jgi:hypothetical protein
MLGGMSYACESGTEVMVGYTLAAPSPVRVKSNSTASQRHWGCEPTAAALV